MYVDINECNSPGHGCHHQCVNMPGSYRCVCNTGYSLNADGFTCSGESSTCSVRTRVYRIICTDIDECRAGTDNCNQLCRNNIGSFSCTCNVPGSTLDNNGYTCNGRCKIPLMGGGGGGGSHFPSLHPLHYIAVHTTLEGSQYKTALEGSHFPPPRAGIRFIISTTV